MLAKVAPKQQEGVLEPDLRADLTSFERWHSGVIFRCSGLVLCAIDDRVKGWHDMVLALAHAPSSGAWLVVCPHHAARSELFRLLYPM